MSETKTTGLRSFTLVELLIVIAILAVLAAAVVIVLNPAELLAQARDTQRISDVNMMRKAVDLFIVDNSSVSLGTPNRVYISIPDSSTSCANITGLPTLPAGWQYVCAPAATLRSTTGNGWLPLNFSLVKGGSPIPSLPIDPQNDPSLTKYYQYIAGTGTFELTTLMESEKQAKAAGSDGGTDAGRLEVGSDVSLWKTASQLVGFWNFNEGSGTTLSDISGSGYNGTWSGTEPHYGAGLSGMAGVFTDDDYIVLPSTILNGRQKFTVSVWVNSDYDSDIDGLFSFETAGTSWRMSIYGDYVRLRDNDGLTHDIHLGPLTSDVWHNLTFVYDGAAAKFTPYIDGVSIGDTTCGSAMYSDMGSFRIGSALQTEYNFSGSIDDFRIYHRSLSPSEVSAIYHSGS